MRSNGVVVVISSHVARGSVGNRAMVFALERLGFTVWAVPTVLLPHHPGLGAAERIVPESGAFERLLQALIQDERASSVAGIVSGYLAHEAQARAVAAFVEAVKAQRPDTLYVCDPVIGDSAGGDGGGLYVDEDIADSVRDRLLPLADAATPNAFECAWLAGHAGGDAPDLAALAGQLPSPIVLATSAPGLMRGQIGNLLVRGNRVALYEHLLLDTAIKGTGDVLTALLLARRLEGLPWPAAVELALSSVAEMLAASVKADADSLLLAPLQAALVDPRMRVSVRRMGSAG